MNFRVLTFLLAVALTASLWGCAPTVQVKAPTEPITINLNIKHEITVKVDKDLEDLFQDEDDIF
jgi:type IV pilus biogenesis protein CpaD/CtpE